MAKVGKIFCRVSMRRWATPLAYAFVLTGIPLQDWMFNFSVVAEE